MKMSVDRRQFLKAGTGMAALTMLPTGHAAPATPVDPETVSSIHKLGVQHAV